MHVKPTPQPAALHGGALIVQAPATPAVVLAYPREHVHAIGCTPPPGQVYPIPHATQLPLLPAHAAVEVDAEK